MGDYEQMSIPILKNIAREKGLRGYSRLKKSALIKKLREPITLRDLSRTLLKQLARERGLRRYSRLKKSELIQRLSEHGSTILDMDISTRMANVPILTPTPYTQPPTPITSRLPPSNAVKDLLEYLDKNVRNKPTKLNYRTITKLRRLLNIKNLKKEIDEIYEQMKLFEVKEGESGLSGFAKVYTINGIEEYDPRTFLYYARKNMTKTLQDNRNTKVKLVLKCFMYHTIDDITKPFDFHSNIEINLEGTDEVDIYVSMSERVLEKNS